MNRQIRADFGGTAGGSINRALCVADGVGRTSQQSIPLGHVVTEQIKYVRPRIVADVASIQRAEPGLAEEKLRVLNAVRAQGIAGHEGEHLATGRA